MIVIIKDRHLVDSDVFHTLVINHKHSLDKKNTGTKYYSYRNNSNISDFFTGIFYNATNCYVNWPGECVGTCDHQSTNPFYIVCDWKNNTSAPIRKEKFYTLCAIKEQYRKLFTPANQSKVYFPPSEQCRDVNVDSSVLFSSRTYNKPVRYKYLFLTDLLGERSDNFDDTVPQPNGREIGDVRHYDDNVQYDECSDTTETESDDEINGTFSDDTLLYDKSSYKDTEDCLNKSDSDVFFGTIKRMHRKVKSEHHDAIKKLMTSDLSKIVDDAVLTQELANCREDGNWHQRVIGIKEHKIGE